MTGAAVLIYRRDFLPLSETFISDHVRALEQYHPIVACERDLPAPHRADIRAHVISGGWIGKTLLSSRGFSPSLSRLVGRKKPLLIHAHFLFDAVRIMRFARRMSLPLVVTAHGYDATLSDAALRKMPSGRQLLARTKELQEYVTKVICVSDFIRDELVSRGYPPEKLVTIPLGVDVEALSAYRKPVTSRRGVITVGRLVEKKGTRYLIEAYAKLPQALRDEHPLTIIGEGHLRGALEQLSSQLGAGARFLGGLPRTKALSLVASQKVFCFPSARASNGDAEGMGVAAMEAMALGVPIVIFDRQPIASIVAESDAGVVVESKSSDALSNGIARILEDDALCSSLADRGSNVARSRFSMTGSYGRLEDLYCGVLAGIRAKLEISEYGSC